jgi:hypothetical protein
VNLDGSLRQSGAAMARNDKNNIRTTEHKNDAKNNDVAWEKT